MLGVSYISVVRHKIFLFILLYLHIALPPRPYSLQNSFTLHEIRPETNSQIHIVQRTKTLFLYLLTNLDKKPPR